MKSSKAASTSSAQEACGVWLDPVQLKQKSKKKRVARPISKLLNPFAEGSGYSLSVALNFTQTKMEMPKTKQSSISTFFTSHRRILNKKSTCEDSMSDLGQPSSSHSSTVLVSGMKRDRGAFLETSNLCKGSDWERGNFAEPERTRFEKPTSIDSPFLHMDAAPKEENAEEYRSPQRKRRLFDSQNLHSVQQPWSQDPLLTWSQFSESDQKHAITEPRSPNTLQSEEAFGNLMDEKGRTSTQKSLKLSQSSHTDKENITSVSLYSPRKHSFSNVRHISLHKDVNPRLLSPQKERNQSLKDLVNRKGSGSESQIIWTKPHSPLKTAALAAQQQSKGLEDESFSALFTQDSQGLRVIAHRDVEGRSPLRDQGNIFTGVVKSYNSVDDDEEEDGMLFTQDSQGNVVIKH